MFHVIYGSSPNITTILNTTFSPPLVILAFPSHSHTMQHSLLQTTCTRRCMDGSWHIAHDARTGHGMLQTMYGQVLARCSRCTGGSWYVADCRQCTDGSSHVTDDAQTMHGRVLACCIRCTDGTWHVAYDMHGRVLHVAEDARMMHMHRPCTDDARTRYDTRTLNDARTR